MERAAGGKSLHGCGDRPLGTEGLLPGDAPAGIRDERVLAGLRFFTDREERPVGLRGGRAVDALLGPREVVERGGEQPERRRLVQEQRGRFAAPLDAGLELGVRLRVRLQCEVRASEVEAPYPGVIDDLRGEELLDGLSRVSLRERRLAAQQEPVCLRILLEASAELVRDLEGLRFAPRFLRNARDREEDRCGAVQRLSSIRMLTGA